MMQDKVRLIGLAKLIGGSVVFAIGFWFVMTYGDQVRTHRGPLGPAIAAGLPGVFALIGILELCTGEKISKISDRWDELAVWNQWLLGILVVALAFGITIGIFMSLAFLDII